MKNLDVFVSEWAGQYPEFAGSDESSWSERAWDMMKERAQPAPGWHNEEWLKKTAEEYHNMGGFQTASFGSAPPDNPDENPDGESEELVDSLGHSVPFSRHSIRMAVDRYVRQFSVNRIDRSSVLM
jgi:hypothetical protein